MTSRLDRLLLLLDTGSSPSIRAAAAKQIGQLAAKSITRDVGGDSAALDVKAHITQEESDASEWAEVLSVVARILPLLQSRSFETRTAASIALSHVASLVPVWSPGSTKKSDPGAATLEPPAFPPFSVAQLIQTAPLLLASSAAEFAKADVGGPRNAERARQEAMRSMGIDFVDPAEGGWTKELLDEAEGNGNGDVKMEDVKSEVDEDAGIDDALVKKEESPVPAKQARVQSASAKESLAPAPAPAPPAPAGDTSGLSARERNRLKRKLKPGNTAFVTATPVAAAAPSRPPPPPANKVRVVQADNGRPRAQKLEHSTQSPTGTPTPAPAESEKVIIDPTKGGQVDAKDKTPPLVKALEVQPGTWVWDGVINILETDLFNANWEVRHGAALGLREVLKAQGASGGMKAGAPQDENDHLHEKWCNDRAAKYLCVFVLDRFGDFVSDQVIAPVRETVSQTLASLLLHMPHRSVLHVHGVLLQMIKQDFEVPEVKTNGKGPTHRNGRTHVWEVRHAGLLGIKYEVAVRSDLVELEGGKDVLRGVVDAAVLGLGDHDDDVRSVAASCLLPVAAFLVENLPEELPRVLAVLWSCLGDMKDDLSSSVGAVMDLLGKLVTYEKVTAILANPETSHPLAILAPNIYPFFRHTISGVRLAVVKTFRSFLNVPSLSKDWITISFLRLLFQNLLLEERADIRDATFVAWRVALSVLGSELTTVIGGDATMTWFNVIMQPIGVPIDTSLLYHPAVDPGSATAEKHNVDKHMIAQDLLLVAPEIVWKARIICARALAYLMSVVPTENLEPDFATALNHYFNSPSMLQKFLSSTILEEWAVEFEAKNPNKSLMATSSLANDMGRQLVVFLESPLPLAYHEMHPSLHRIAADCNALLNAFALDAKVPQSKIPTLPANLDIYGNDPSAFTIATAEKAVGAMFNELKTSLGRTKKKELAIIEERRKRTVETIQAYSTSKEEHDCRVAAAVGAAAIALRAVPSKVGSLIKRVMDGVKFQANLDLQTRSAVAVARVVAFGVTQADSPLLGPVNKIITNLGVFLCQDIAETPVFSVSHKQLEGILSYRKASPATSNGAKAGKTKVMDPSTDSSVIEEEKLFRRGAELAFGKLCETFGPQLFERLPLLWELMSADLIDAYARATSPTEADDRMKDPRKDGKSCLGQVIIDSLTLIRCIVPTLHESLWHRLHDVFPYIVLALRSRFAVVRQSAARCFSSICNVLTVDAMKHVVEHVVPLIGDAGVVTNRQGAIELIYHIVNTLDIKALPYVIFMIVPVLGRTSDPDEEIRSTATNTFATLVKMVPLEAGLPDPPGFSEELLKRRETEREFLTQLLDGSKVQEYRIPVPINAELRKYQQDGVNWLAFLAKYQLHGILCDDMGLGKTLQSICILASKHFERAERYKATKSPDAAPLPSLIVCPPTLTGHWYHEILKYTTTLRPLLYAGATRDRRRIVNSIPSYDVVITSYDVVRNDVADLSKFNWVYCILDEGHVIKNAKTKLTVAVKTIRAHHRLVLSGTPIQNNVLELWSIFDFLMPGFLGSESSFQERFGKPILANRDAKTANAKLAEAAAHALEALHKQVLPFLLRRMKEDVLGDLPPKIIQDYYCDLSELQKALYEEFANSQAQNAVKNALQQNGKQSAGKQHVFQSLQYLRKLCNHPALVLKENDPMSEKFLRGTNLENGIGNIRDIQHAPKMQALRQLLNDCGIGTNGSNEDTADDQSGPLVSQHRVLIFCQMKQMLDMIETDLFKANMPSVTYMRLDGSTDVNKRHAIVQTFNADPSIDCLLLTTHVGGLGLTLTGADTVIFFDHDWNPSNDLQAMDRAHRLGQKKVVNVYRLITKGTLEEKIMGLQRFKLNIANSIITQQNSGLASMDTDLVLDLFKTTTPEEDAAAAKRRKKETENGPVSQKAILEGLEDLPAADEYESLDLGSFMSSLGR